MGTAACHPRQRCPAVMHFAAWLSAPDSVRILRATYRNSLATGTIGAWRRWRRRQGRQLVLRRHAPSTASRRDFQSAKRIPQPGERTARLSWRSNTRRHTPRARLRDPVAQVALLQRGGCGSGRRTWKSRAVEIHAFACDRSGLAAALIDIFGEDYPTSDVYLPSDTSRHRLRMRTCALGYLGRRRIGSWQRRHGASVVREGRDRRRRARDRTPVMRRSPSRRGSGVSVSSAA
jgi:hypothetical protein